MQNNILPKKKAIFVFFVFAFGYFLSCLLRAITATLSPVLTSEFNLRATDTGLLTGGYFSVFLILSIISYIFFLILNRKKYENKT